MSTKTLTRAEALANVANLKTIREAAALARHWLGDDSSMYLAIRQSADSKDNMNTVRHVLMDYANDSADKIFAAREPSGEGDDTGLTCPLGWGIPPASQPLPASTPSHEYAFDVKLQGAVRFRADNEGEARRLLGKYLDSANTNFGEQDNGDPLLGEVSIIGSAGEANLYEIDGNPATSPTMNELVEALSDSLIAWEGEEDSVKEEHEELILQLQGLLGRVKS